MNLTLGILMFCFGVTIGSFVNVIVGRLPKGQNPWRGRSHCPKCRHALSAADLVPLLSFIGLRGQCRYCRARISSAYFWGELFMGLAWLITGLGAIMAGYDSAHLVVSLLIVSLLVLLFLYDLRTQLLPDIFVGPLVILSVIWALIWPGVYSNSFALPLTFFTLDSNLISGLAAALAAAGFLGLLWLVTRGRGMGLGDVKLALALGFLSGWPMIVDTLLGAFISGAIVGIILLSRGTKTLKSRLAFGPFLIGAQLIIWWWQLYN